MPLPEATLEGLAVQHTDAILGKLIVGKTTYDLGSLSLEWNGFFRRYLYKQQMVVWRDLGDVELVLSESRRVIRFRDARRLEGGKHQKLTEPHLLAITRTSGIVGGNAELEDVVPGDLYELVVKQDEVDLPRKIRFTINAKSKQVAAFDVLEDVR